MNELIIIEDNDVFRLTLARVVNSSDQFYCENAFSSAENALKSIQSNHLVPDILLLDIGLPGISGIDFIPQMRTLSPSTKIIILTIHDDNQNVFNAICAGASGYLLKDLSADRIISSLAEVLEGGAPMNAQIAKKVLEMFRDASKPTGDYSLSKREKEILSLLVDGLSKKNISEKLFLSYHTVDSHIRNIYAKLEVHSRTGAVSKALQENLLPYPPK